MRMCGPHTYIIPSERSVVKSFSGKNIFTGFTRKWYYPVMVPPKMSFVYLDKAQRMCYNYNYG